MGLRATPQGTPPVNSVLRGTILAGVACLAIGASGLVVDARSDEKLRPKLSLKAQPSVGISPARVTLTAELSGGANDFQEYYCPTIVWDWADDTESESTYDCGPYEAGKSEIRRRFTAQHTFRAGAHKVWVRLKRSDKVLVSASVNIHIQPGPHGDERDN